MDSLDSPLTAAQKVFAIPELVALIVEAHLYFWRRSERRESNGWMRINSLWHQTTARYIWKICGAPGNGPRIVDLIKTAPRPERTQWYANHIEQLTLFAPENSLRNGDSEDWAHFIHLLPTLLFPRLRSIRFYYKDSGDVRGDAGLAVSPYLRPNLKQLVLHSPRMNSDFLGQLKVRSVFALHFSIRSNEILEA